MKRHILIFLTLILSLSAFDCRTARAQHVMLDGKLRGASHQVEAAGGELTVRVMVYPEHLSWNVQRNKELPWLRAEQVDDTTLRIKVYKNSSQKRSGRIVVVTTKADTAFLRIDQKGADNPNDTYIHIDGGWSGMRDVSSERGELTLPVATDAQWWSTEELQSEWCSLHKLSKTAVKVKYMENYGADPRTVTLWVQTGNGHRASLTLTQEGVPPELSIDRKEQNFAFSLDSAGTRAEFHVSANGTCTVEIPNEWLHGHLNDETLVVTADRNNEMAPRTGYIAVKNGTKRIILTAEQAGSTHPQKITEPTPPETPAKDEPQLPPETPPKAEPPKEGKVDYMTGVDMGYNSLAVRQSLTNSSWEGEDFWGKRYATVDGGYMGVHFQPCAKNGVGLYTGGRVGFFVAHNESGNPDDSTLQGMYDYCRETSFSVPLHLMYRLRLTKGGNVALLFHAGPDIHWYFGKRYSSSQGKHPSLAPDYGTYTTRNHLDASLSLAADLQLGPVVVNAAWAYGILDHRLAPLSGADTPKYTATHTSRLSVGISILFHKTIK